MISVLLITYYWPPAGGGGVFRWLKMSKYFDENEIDLTVYTPSNPEFPAIDHSLLSEVSPKIKMIKTSIKEPYGIYKKFTGKSQDKKIYSGFINDKKSFAQKLSIWIRGNFFIPDARKFWIRPSIKFLSDYCTKNEFHAIISTGPPHSMHMIARGIKSKFTKIKWIADFRDPWTNIDFYDQLMLTKRADQKHRKLEKAVLREADQVVTVGPTLARELDELGSSSKVKVVTNGFDHLDFLQGNPLSEEFTIMHLGSMNKDRNPEVLWKALIQLANRRLHPKVEIVGQTDASVKSSIAKYDLEDQVFFESFVPHDEAISKMKSAHLLLLVINNTPNAAGILTGKLFEYLGSKRPILIIGPQKGDVKDLMEEFSHVFYITYEEKQKCTEIINSIMKDSNKLELADTLKYSRKSLANDYCEIIKKLCRA